jgi:hypothetical protein
MEDLKKKCIVLFGAAMYLKETVLIFEVMDMVLSIDKNDIDKERVEKIETYISEQYSTTYCSDHKSDFLRNFSESIFIIIRRNEKWLCWRVTF